MKRYEVPQIRLAIFNEENVMTGSGINAVQTVENEMRKNLTEGTEIRLDILKWTF